MLAAASLGTAAPPAAAYDPGEPAADTSPEDGAHDPAATPPEDRLLVRWAPATSVSERHRRLSTFAADHGVTDAQVVPVSRRVDMLALPGLDVAGLAVQVAAWPEVVLAEPDAVVRVGTLESPRSDRGPDRHAKRVQDGSELPERPAIALPDDPLLDDQWGLRNLGGTVGPPLGDVAARSGVDVRVPAAWATTRGDPQVTVAVIDTAVELSHPDLVGAVTLAPAPVAESDEEGADEVPGSLAHGTAVASVIAARADDGFGIAGVAPEVQVLSIGVFAGQPGGPGTSTTSLVTAAFEAAADAGADVINASWVTGQDSAVLRAAIADVGVPVVAASGNEARTIDVFTPLYPPAYGLSNVVVATAIDPSGMVPGFANIGAEVVDLAAPGVRVLAAAPGGTHEWYDGTSFAVPHVSGALALARSVAPEATTGELIDALRGTTRYEPALDSVTSTAGMLDVAALLARLERPVCDPTALPRAAFPDLPDGPGAVRGVDCLAAERLIVGRSDGTFGPSELVTRAQAATMAAAVLDAAPRRAWWTREPPALPEPAPLGDALAGLVDVDPGHVHAPAIARLTELGVLRGDASGRFHPQRPISRGQLAAVLVGVHDVLMGTSGQAPSRRWFTDTDSSVHAATIDRARDLGLLQGTDRLRASPDATTRRDLAADRLADLLDALAREGEAR